jgi:hypothetical protein
VDVPPKAPLKGPGNAAQTPAKIFYSTKLLKRGMQRSDTYRVVCIQGLTVYVSKQVRRYTEHRVIVA